MQIYQLLNQNSTVVEGIVLPLGFPEEVYIALHMVSSACLQFTLSSQVDVSQATDSSRINALYGLDSWGKIWTRGKQQFKQLLNH